MCYYSLIFDFKVSLNLIIFCVKIMCFIIFSLIVPKVSLYLILFYSACSSEQCV